MVKTRSQNSQMSDDENVNESTMVEASGYQLNDILKGIAALGASVQKLCDYNTQNKEDMRQLRAAVTQIEEDRRTPSSQVTTMNETIDRNCVNPSTSSEQTPNANTSLTTSSDAVIKLYNLPIYDGKPEEWPLFYANFTDSTREFRYSDRQNLKRLHKALQGDAKRAVASLLISPENVPEAVEELKFNFGRPELLVQSQLEALDRCPKISEGQLREVLPLANKVTNIVALFTSAKCEHHLTNPMMLQKLSEKLPLTQQYEWAKYTANIKPFPLIKDFGQWIKELAKVISTMPVSAPNIRSAQPSRHSDSRLPSKRVLVNNETKESRIQKTSCCHCKKEHTIQNCSLFRALEVDEKWKLVKYNRLCFSCLRTGHSLQYCRGRKACGESGCQRMHHPLLHNDNSNGKQQTPDFGNAQILNCRQSRPQQGQHFFKIVPVILRGPVSTVATYAMLDDGSSVTLIEEYVADLLGTKGQATTLTLQWYDNAVKTENSKRVSCEIRGKGPNARSYALKNVRMVKGLDLPIQSLNKENYDHLRELPLINYQNARPSILLGLDNSYLGVCTDVVENGPDQPIAAATRLGWMVFGKPGDTSVMEPRVLMIKQPTLKNINKLVEEYFSVENFGVKYTDMILESDENKRARQILTTTTKLIAGRYETGLLWQASSPSMPESFNMAKRRLFGVERKMVQDPLYASASVK